MRLIFGILSMLIMDLSKGQAKLIIENQCKVHGIRIEIRKDGIAATTIVNVGPGKTIEKEVQDLDWYRVRGSRLGKVCNGELDSTLITKSSWRLYYREGWYHWLAYNHFRIVNPACNVYPKP